MDIDGEKTKTFGPKAGDVADAPAIEASGTTSIPLCAGDPADADPAAAAPEPPLPVEVPPDGLPPEVLPAETPPVAIDPDATPGVPVDAPLGTSPVPAVDPDAALLALGPLPDEEQPNIGRKRATARTSTCPVRARDNRAVRFIRAPAALWEGATATATAGATIQRMETARLPAKETTLSYTRHEHRPGAGAFRPNARPKARVGAATRRQTRASNALGARVSPNSRLARGAFMNYEHIR